VSVLWAGLFVAAQYGLLFVFGLLREAFICAGFFQFDAHFHFLPLHFKNKMKSEDGGERFTRKVERERDSSQVFIF
jgi:hypothetical protein